MRLPSVDFLRGIIMAVMVIDHAREYADMTYKLADPVDLSQTPPEVFAMRWVTHFCAPVFTFLMGLSASFSAARRKPAEFSRHMAVRGLVLIALELTVCNWAWTFNPLWHRMFFQVIGALGTAMLALALVSRLNSGWIWGIGLAIVGFHNTLDGVSFPLDSAAHYVWSFLHQKNVLPLWGKYEIRTTYPVLPVIGIAICGFAAGNWFRGLTAGDLRKRLVLAGAVLVALFLALRLTNLYGDPSRFEPQSTALFTLFAIGNVTKYPISLLFAAMTIGPALILLGAIHQRDTAWMKPFVTLGRTPMFFYLAHLVLLHLGALAGAWILGFREFDFVKRYGGIPGGFTFPVLGAIPFAIAVTAALLPLCRWYAALRTRFLLLSYF